MADLTIDASSDGTLGLLHLRGEARLEVIDALRDKAKALLSQGATHLLLGVKDVGFMDSASFGVVLDLQKALKAKGGDLILVGPSARFLKMIDGMGLAGRFATAPSETAARALARPPPTRPRPQGQ